jgi:peptide/nickel transport system substrate-binding protein
MAVTALGTPVVTRLYVDSAFAAEDKPVSGGTLIWGHSEKTQNLDIHQTGTASTLRVLANVHEPIVTITKNFKVIPNLAESFDVSEDGLTYTFHLRKGVKFQNGTELTSADVKYSFERVKDPATGAVNNEVFKDVESIETPDDLTVVIKLSQVYAPFLARLAENGAGAVIPKGSGDVQGTRPVGAGAFSCELRVFGNEVRLARFDGYWKGPAHLERVVAREITEPTVRLTGLQTGELHLINDIPADRVAKVEKDPKLQVDTWFPLNFDFVNFNHKVKPFDDPRVRLAFDLMIDKQMLLEGALWGQGKVTASPSFPQHPSYDTALKQCSQDFDQARKLLADAGFGPGKLNVVFKVTTNYPYHVQSAQIMLEWFQACGVKMSIEQLTWSDWLSQVWHDRDFQMTMMNFFTLWEPDYLYYNLWNSKGSFNYRNIHDPEIDELTEKARTMVDRDQRMKLYKDVQQRIHDQTHDVILWFRNGSFGAQQSVGGLDGLVDPNGSNLRFHGVWLKK